jgi:saccharopine dehydrogenase-like NADP-dependent oxidoreductase
MGSVIAWDLARSSRVDSVSVADIDEERLGRLRRRVGSRKLTTSVQNLRDE